MSNSRFDNNNLIATDKKIIWHPFTPLLGNEPPILIEKARGAYLYTEDGRKILDAISSWWVNLHGHSNEYIANAIASQALQAEHIIFAGFTHQPAITLGERLISILPSNQSKIFYSDNGSTAVEVGIKMALQYWYNLGTPKKRIIAFEGAYHGDTFGSMSVAQRGPFNAAFQSHLFHVDFIELPERDNFENVKQALIELINLGDVCSFIYEPLIQGSAGMRIYEPQLLDELLNIAKRNDILCIADEVMTGFGRTGKLFASLYLENMPDIVCLSKGITGGFMPLGVTSCNQKVVSAFETDEILKAFFHGHSYTANPMACAAANASLDLLLSSTCQEDIARITELHKKFISEINNPKIRNARCLGTLMAIELEDTRSSSYFSDMRKLIYPHFIGKNILLRPLGNVIYILPPYIITNNELDYIYKEIKDFIEGL